MKRFVLAIGLAVAAGCATPQKEDSGALRAEVESAIQSVYPTLVRIHVVWMDYGGGRQQKYEASGSGSIISPDGLVVTNHHVAGRATLITCTLPDRQEISARLVGSDAMADIAVLRLNLEERKDPAAPVAVARFGDSDTLRVGDTVFSMGCPLALSQSVTRGIVANPDMIMPRFFGGGMEMDGENVGGIVKWIGHDAVIFPGNSGGPLVNTKGEIVGINEIGVGLGGAIPGNLAKQIVAEIVERGSVARSWVGVEIQPLLRGSRMERGVLVSGVIAGGPADRAGLRSGDVLLSFDGQALAARFDEDLPKVNRVFLGTPVGKAVALSWLRDGQEMAGELTTEVRGKARGEEHEYPTWGVTGQDITAMDAIGMRRAPMSGVKVSSYRDGGPAAEAKPPIQWGDVITEVDGKKVQVLEDLTRVTDGIVKGQESPVPTVVAFERGLERILTVVKIGPEPPDRSTEVRKAWFPSAFQVLTRQLAEKVGLKGKKGVRITQVYPGTTVESGGFRVGDILLAMDGEEIAATQPEDTQVFPHMVRARKPGTTVEMTVVRDGKEVILPLVLPVRPPEGRELASHKDTTFEFTVREISFRDRVDNRWEQDQKGAVVSAVESGGWAAFGGLGQGDLVLEIDGKPIATVDDVKAAMEAVGKSKPKHVTFRVRRWIHTEFIEVMPAW